MVDMLNDRWQPTPRPEWVTCIPSLNHPTLVPDFARRLADALGLPFVPVVVKIKENGPQKVQQNRFHQCRNLDGVFGIDGKVLRGPVLLIDDVVDSGWTMTIASVLLRNAGSGPVWPCALTTSSIGFAPHVLHMCADFEQAFCDRPHRIQCRYRVRTDHCRCRHHRCQPEHSEIKSIK